MTKKQHLHRAVGKLPACDLTAPIFSRDEWIKKISFPFLQELTKNRKSLILKLLAGLLDVDDHLGESGYTYSNTEEAGERSLEERAVVAGIPRREQKAPCKLFFWKTFSHC